MKIVIACIIGLFIYSGCCIINGLSYDWYDNHIRCGNISIGNIRGHGFTYIIDSNNLPCRSFKFDNRNFKCVSHDEYEKIKQEYLGIDTIKGIKDSCINMGFYVRENGKGIVKRWYIYTYQLDSIRNIFIRHKLYE
ncbi:MAG: hypothetical protein NT007_13825 [Candidatus Kapabacteria bacterium]|nr:hypothetical protein [Candidatus Kapabacteria bacterium]